MMIDEFLHEETDNFLYCYFQIDNIDYCSSENYFQCAKTVSIEERELIRKSGPGLSCWEAGNKIKLRDDWEKVKVFEMYKGNKAKFEQNPELAEKLIFSKGTIGGGQSSDFWNYWNGIMLTRIRAELRKNEEDLKVIEETTALMDKFAKE